MGIKVSAIFLMAVLIAGLSSFPSSISNSSTEFVDQTNSLNLINTVFADSDEDEDDEDKEKGKPAGVGKPESVGKDKEKKLSENQAKDDDDEYEDEDYEDDEDKEKGKPANVGQEKKLSENQAKDDDDEYEDEDYEDDIQEFNDATIIHMSGTTTICHVPPGNPGNAHEITVSKNALKGHERHGDFEHSGYCADNGLGDILSIKEMKHAQKLTRLSENQSGKESMTLDRANTLIEKLE